MTKPVGEATVHLNCNKGVSADDKQRVEAIAKNAGMKFACSDVGYANDSKKLEIIVDARTAPRTRDVLLNTEFVERSGRLELQSPPQWFQAKQTVADDFAKYLKDSGIEDQLKKAVNQPTVPVFAEIPKGAKVGQTR
jgi:hypothetical protein